MPLAQMQGEDPPVLDIDVLEDVRHEFELLVVADEARVAVDHHEARVLGPADQHVQLAARLADRLAAGAEIAHQGFVGWAGTRRWRGREQAGDEQRDRGEGRFRQR